MNKENKDYLIPKKISDHVLMVGVYWKNHAPGGISSVVNEYANNFETFKYITTAASRDENKFKKLYFAIRGLFLFVLRLLFDRQIKIVHVQGSFGASYDRKKIFVRIAKIFHKSVIWHMHASQFVPFYESRKDKKNIVKTLNLSDSLIVLSQYYKDFYEEIGVEKEKIRILNNIVPHPSLNKNNPIDRNINFLFLGEISNRKGVFELLDAIALHKDELKNKISLKIGGNGEIERLKNAINNLGLRSFVRFEGWVNGQKKIDLLNWADVYILPSHNEGLPISILEALSYKCPIISTPVGGIEEVVHNNENGLIVQPGNLDEIYQAISYYVSNPDDILKEGEISQQIVFSFYPESVFESLKEIYNKYL